MAAFLNARQGCAPALIAEEGEPNRLSSPRAPMNGRQGDRERGEREGRQTDA